MFVPLVKLCTIKCIYFNQAKEISHQRKYLTFEFDKKPLTHELVLGRKLEKYGLKNLNFIL